jgi:hypothetical protein
MLHMMKKHMHHQHVRQAAACAFATAGTSFALYTTTEPCTQTARFEELVIEV